MTEIARRLKIALPTVSGAVQKVEEVVRGESLDVMKFLIGVDEAGRGGLARPGHHFMV